MPLCRDLQCPQCGGTGIRHCNCCGRSSCCSSSRWRVCKFQLCCGYCISNCGSCSLCKQTLARACACLIAQAFQARAAMTPAGYLFCSNLIKCSGGITVLVLACRLHRIIRAQLSKLPTQPLRASRTSGSYASCHPDRLLSHSFPGLCPGL